MVPTMGSCCEKGRRNAQSTDRRGAIRVEKSRAGLCAVACKYVCRHKPTPGMIEK